MQLRAWTAQRSNLTFESGHELDMTQAVLEASLKKMMLAIQFHKFGCVNFSRCNVSHAIFGNLSR